MTPLETHCGIRVKREDLHPSGFPSGKLRGVLPYLESLRNAGIRRIVNAGATHSNSHAIAAFAAREIGLELETLVNSNREHPAPAVARRYGARVVLTAPGHLGPLRSRAAKRAAETGATLLPWGLVAAEICERYADAVDEIGPNDSDVHVVPFGAGGWAAGVWRGLQRGGYGGRVVAVRVMPTSDVGDAKRARAALAPFRSGGFGLAATSAATLPSNFEMTTPEPVDPPFPCDPKYERPAWGVARRLSLDVPVVFWSIGQPMDAIGGVDA